MGRSPCCEDIGMKKGPWTPEEDDKLINYIHKHGHGSWRALPRLAGLNRCGKSCRLRWTNYLRPDIKRGKFSQEEEQTILNLHAILGNKWSAIATHLPGRTDNEIKNYWNTHLKKKLIQMGFDPMTHQPRTDIFSTLPHLIALANLIQNPSSSWEDQNQVAQISRLNNHLHHMMILNPPSLLKDTTPPPYLHHSLPVHPAPAPALGDCFTKDGITGLGGSSPQSAAVLSQGDISPDGSSSPWLALPPITQTSITNTGDACSTSSYGGEQMWSELLDDPFFHEIA